MSRSCRLNFPPVVPPTYALPYLGCTIRVPRLKPRLKVPPYGLRFAPGSGSQFALLPFEPGTCNFTKIVQRVPVKIRFDVGQPGVDALRPGLSVTAKVTLVE